MTMRANQPPLVLCCCLFTACRECDFGSAHLPPRSCGRVIIVWGDVVSGACGGCVVVVVCWWWKYPGILTDHRRKRHGATGPRRKRPLAAVRMQGVRWSRLGGDRVAMLQAHRNRTVHDCHDARWPTIRGRARPARPTAAAAVATTDRIRRASEGGTRHNHHTGWNPS